LQSVLQYFSHQVGLLLLLLQYFWASIANNPVGYNHNQHVVRWPRTLGKRGTFAAHYFAAI